MAPPLTSATFCTNTEPSKSVTAPLSNMAIAPPTFAASFRENDEESIFRVECISGRSGSCQTIIAPPPCVASVLVALFPAKLALSPISKFPYSNPIAPPNPATLPWNKAASPIVIFVSSEATSPSANFMYNAPAPQALSVALLSTN